MPTSRSADWTLLNPIQPYRSLGHVAVNWAVLGWVSAGLLWLFLDMDNDLHPVFELTVSLLAILRILIATDQMLIQRLAPPVGDATRRDEWRTAEIVAAGPWISYLVRPAIGTVTVALPVCLALASLIVVEGMEPLALVSMMIVPVFAWNWAAARTKISAPPRLSEILFAAFPPMSAIGGVCGLATLVLVGLAVEGTITGFVSAAAALAVAVGVIASVLWRSLAASRTLLASLELAPASVRTALGRLPVSTGAVALYGAASGMLAMGLAMVLVMAGHAMAGAELAGSGLDVGARLEAALGLPNTIHAVMAMFGLVPGAVAGLVTALLLFRPWRRRDQGTDVPA